ncbi:hypothetical protein M8C21_002952, partial [Ambrosia artemisiifolia]
EGGAKIGELGDLDLLEGELEIRGLENVEGFSEAESANIKCKTNLSVLKLSWTKPNRVQGRYKCDGKEVLEGLEPNPGLKGFHEDDTNMSGDNPNIFPSLQTLEIYHCPSLVSLPSNLPKLRVLKLGYCEKLVSIPDEILKDLNKLYIPNWKRIILASVENNG